ncbi:MAG: DUF4430 domain-containing protein [Candidatus Diapherotrites archaeon]|nr:DUF4430 domain-containing protein [Candidatus Diapherotrites archaeon]
MESAGKAGKWGFGKKPAKETATQKIDWRLFAWLGVLIIVWVCYAFFSQWAGLQQAAPSGGAKITVIFRATDSSGAILLDKAIAIEDGKTVFDATKAADSTLKYTEYQGMGVMVNSIAGTAPAPDQYWALYVNGKFASAGASTTTLSGNTLVEWKIESISSYPQ